MRALPNRPGVVAQSPGHTVRLYNRSKQKLSLQVAPPGSDFFRSEQQVHLIPGKTVVVPKDHLRWEQIENLRKSGFLSVVYDSEQ